ncbi:MAG TPA: NAD(P)-dependent oxidoreductase [bacterium]|nr:NAD(P)-dependent oxidoreductase [bacterium]
MDGRWNVVNSGGTHRIVVTKDLPGDQWLEILENSQCRIDVCQSRQVLSPDELRDAIGDECAGVIGQLTEYWNKELFGALARAGGRVYSNYAVGYDNVDVETASARGIAVGNTPGVLTETTAELAVALTFAATRRIVEADDYMRSGQYDGWLPDLFLGELLWRKTLGVVGAGRIGTAYARMMVEGHRMNLIYVDVAPNNQLEAEVVQFNSYLESIGEQPVRCTHADDIDSLLAGADVVSLHPALTEDTYHLISGERLARMKENAILVNASRGAVIDEAALVEHCTRHPQFRVGLDVYENEPEMAPGLAELDNVVVAPHIGSATRWTRNGMAILAARNIIGILHNYPIWNQEEMSAFLHPDAPAVTPSIINREALELPVFPNLSG